MKGRIRLLKLSFNISNRIIHLKTGIKPCFLVIYNKGIDFCVNGEYTDGIYNRCIIYQTSKNYG